VPKGVWREMNNFSTNSLALILSSTPYSKADYIYNYEEFLDYLASGGHSEPDKAMQA
jgi:hypothetical protein